jgi:hypothetical protein
MVFCCESEEYRSLPEQVSEDVSITRCTACGRRHIELNVDTGELGLKGSAL